MSITLRALAAEYGMPLAELQQRLDLSETPPDVPLRPRVVTVFRLTLASQGRRTFDVAELVSR